MITSSRKWCFTLVLSLGIQRSAVLLANLLLALTLTACSGGGGGSGSAPILAPPPQPIPVNAFEALRTPEGQPIAQALVTIQTLSGIKLATSISSDIDTDPALDARAAADQAGQFEAELPADTDPDAICHVTVAGGEYIVAVGRRILRTANDTAPEALLACTSLNKDGVFSAEVGGGGLKINFYTSSIVQTLRLYAPLAEYEPGLLALLDRIAAEILTDTSFDRNGDGIVSYLEWSVAPQAVQASGDLDALYSTIRSHAQTYLNMATQDPPNIVVIVADDVGYGDVSAFWDEGDIQTPGIDQIASDGAALTNFHVYPVCSSTRAALLSGRFVRDLRMPGTGGPARAGIPRFTPIIPEYLRQTGYRTGAFGKWHLSSRKGFSPHQRGFQKWLGFYGGASLYNFAEITATGGDFFVNGNEPFNLEEGHLTDVITDEAIQFIEESQTSPFFVYLSYNAAHVPLWSESEPEFSARPDWVELVQADGINGERRQDYVALIRHMDARISDVLTTLTDLDLAEDTIVIFLSDNGADVSLAEDPNKPIGSNALFKSGKSFVYEGGIRVPMAIRWPGTIASEQAIGTFTSLVDLWPTLREIAQIPRRGNDPTAPARGQSLIPLLTGNNDLPNYDRTAYFSFAIRGSTILDYPWKLVRAGQRESLYNLEDDPGVELALRLDAFLDDS
jgi:arylsulfatase A-like enzyme